MVQLRRLTLVLFVAFGVAPLGAQTLDTAALDALHRAGAAGPGIPGLAVAVVMDDSVIFARGYGEREYGTGAPVDEHTLFAIASTTKAFTAAALGMLVDEGVLDWDDPVRRHLPDFELRPVRHAPRHDPRPAHAPRRRRARGQRLDRRALRPRRRSCAARATSSRRRGFREGYGYNNLMYMVAGEVVAAAAGKSWDDFVRVADLRAARDGADDVALRRASRRARTLSSAHHRFGGRIVVMDRRDYDALGPAGSIFSSAWEMAQWVRLHLNGGSYEGRRLLEPATVEEMHTPQVVMRMDSVTRRMFPTQNFAAYGLGWRMHDYHGEKVVQHTGSVNYTRTQVGMIPSKGIGFVAFANLSSSTLQTALMYKVFDMLLGISGPDWSGEYLALAERSAQASGPGETKAAGAEERGPSLPLEAYVGTYADSLYGEVTVDLEDGRLILRYSPDYVADLEHWHFDTFRAHWRSTGFGWTNLTFGLDARARVRTLEMPGYTTFRRR